MGTYRYWTCTAVLGNITKKEKDWYAEFSDAPTIIGWHAIFAYIGENGWEVIQILDDQRYTNANMGGGFNWVVRYRIVCRKPSGS